MGDAVKSRGPSENAITKFSARSARPPDVMQNSAPVIMRFFTSSGIFGSSIAFFVALNVWTTARSPPSIFRTSQ